MARQGVPRPPDGLKAGGRRLWRAVVADFELEEHERELLRQACRTVDLLDALQAVLDADGPMADSSQGIRAHPAVTEARQQRIVLARLLAALGVPSGVEDEQDGRRSAAPRGVYRLRAVEG